MLGARSVLELPLLPRRLFYAIAPVLLSTCMFSQNGDVTPPLADQFEQVARVISGSSDQQAEVLYLQSKIKQNFGEHADALRFAERSVMANPKQAAYHLQLASVLSEELKDARLFRKISLAKRVHSELETALKLEPKNPDCLLGMMMYYEQAPGVLGGSKDKAHHLAEQIGRIDLSKGYLAEAQLARMEKRTNGLGDLYLNAVKADPTSFDALVSLASFYASDVQKKIRCREQISRGSRA